MWSKIVRFFHDSETIFIARTKYTVGLAFTAYTQAGLDLSPFLTNAKWIFVSKILAAWLVLDGTVSEWARKRRADDMDGGAGGHSA